MSARHAALAHAGADAIRDGFLAYRRERERITARARLRFETRDWRGGQRDALGRLEVRDRVLHGTVDAVRAELGPAVLERDVWRAMKDRYAGEVAPREDAEIGLSFFNSVTRRVFPTVGVDRAIEFLAADRPPPSEGAEPVHRTFRREAGAARLLEEVLRAHAFACPFEDLARDARLAATELEAELREGPDSGPIDAIEALPAVFFRGKGAYVVGRIRRGRSVSPLVLALVHGDRGVGLDAILAREEDVSIVFSPGDLLTKNFGVTRHGRVIFYDYDELSRVTDLVFRDIPAARHEEDETSAEPTFYVGERDVFPEEFLPFIGLQGRLRDVFLQAHGELLTARWWRGVQERLRAGEVVDIFPYRDEQRLHHARPGT